MTFLSLTALGIVISTNSRAASHGNFVKMTFLFSVLSDKSVKDRIGRSTKVSVLNLVTEHICCLPQWPILLTWIIFNPSMDIWSHVQSSVGWNYLSIPKLQRWNRWSLGMDKLFHSTRYHGYNYLSMLGFKLIHVSKRGPRYCSGWYITLIIQNSGKFRYLLWDFSSRVKPAWWLDFGQICLCKCSIGWILHSHPSNTSLIDTHPAHLKTNIFKIAWVFKKCLKCVNMFLFGLSEQKYAHFHHERCIYVHISNILCCSLEVTVLMCCRIEQAQMYVRTPEWYIHILQWLTY